MFLMNYMLNVVMVFVFFGVVVLGLTHAPYQGVIALMGISFSCCVLMVVLGRTFAALMLYIVYLGGLIVVFGYCVSVEKEGSVGLKVSGFKGFVMFLVMWLVACLWGMFVGGFWGLLVYPNWENLVCLEVNGSGVFYCAGGFGLVICSWGLLVVLFSILVILSWSRLGGFRPF